MTQPLVINELRAWSKRAKQNGKEVHLVSDTSSYSGELWSFPAYAWNPKTGKHLYLIIRKSRRQQTW